MSDPPEIVWTQSGAPRAMAFDDIYFSAEDGLAEARTVFLQGLGLPEGWSGRRRFAVAELGFGTGLNVLALLDLWRRTRPSPAARLDVWSVEAFPMTTAQAARALAAWPDLADLARPLLSVWPTGRRGVHRVAWPDLGAELVLHVGEAQPSLAAWTGAADAWMLDGFAPSRNPAMWTAELLAAVAARSRPGARAATFTVAGAVRRGLEAAGFTLERRPGHGRKRERLEAHLPGVAADPPPPGRVAVVGDGVAGAALARAFRAQGAVVTVVAGGRPGASSVPAALVTPRLDAGFGAAAILHAEAFARAAQLYGDVNGAVLAQGVVQLEAGPRDAVRFDTIAGWDGFAPGDLRRLDAPAAGAALREAVANGALAIESGLVVDPSVILGAWLEGSTRVTGDVARLEPSVGGWRLLDAAGVAIAEADVVVLAGGAAGTGLLADLPLRPVRGQVEIAGAASMPGRPAAWGGYAAPTATGLMFGATHRRGDASTELREAERERNLATLAERLPKLATSLAGRSLRSWAGVRTAAPDHMPLAGAVSGSPGLYALTGLGGRGFTLAPLLAEHVAALAFGAGSPLPRLAADAVDPARFGTRRARARSPHATPETTRS